MVWSRVQQASAVLSNAFSVSSATLTPTFGTGTTAGNLLVAFVNWASQFTTWGTTDAFTFPSGWVKADGTANGAHDHEEIWYYPNCPSGITSVSVSCDRVGGINNAVFQVWIGEFSGGTTSSPLDQVGHTTGTGTAVSVSTSTADAASGNLIVACVGANTTTIRSFTAGSGYTAETISQSTNVVQDNLFGEHAVSSGATTQTATGTISASETWGAVIATFKSGTPPPAGTASLTLPAPLFAGSADVGVTAQAGITLPAPLVSGEVIGAAGAGALRLPAAQLTAAATVVNPDLAAVALSLPAATLGGTGSYVSLAAGVVLPAPLIGVAAGEHLGPPSISSVTPAIGGELTRVTIRGNNLLTVTDVGFGPYHYYGYPLTALITVVDNTEIQVYAPDPFYLATADLDNLTVDVTVLTPDGTASAPAAYTIVAPPVLSQIAPTLWFPGDPVPTLVIAGKNLQTAYAVEFGPYAVGSSLDVAEDGSQLSVPLFSLVGFAAGVYPVRVWNASGPSAVNNPLFTIAYVAQTPQAADLADALAGRYGPVAISYLLEWHNRDNSFIADITAALAAEDGGTIQLDNDQAVVRTAQFHLLAAALPPGFSATPSSGKCLAPYAQVVTPVQSYKLQLGLFHTDEPQQDQFPLGFEEWQVKASDLCILLSTPTTTATYTVTAGTAYYDAIKAICTRFGLRLEGTAVPPQTLPADVSWQPKTSYLQICNDLALGLNLYGLFADETGLLQLVPRVDPSLVPAGVSYDTTREPNLVVGDAQTPSSRVVDTAQYKNYVSVAIDDPARDAYVASYTNADPSSPLSTTASGKDDLLSINGSSTPSTKAIYDDSTADAIAIFELQEEATRAVQRTLHTQPDPRRTAHEWYRLTLDGFEQNTLWRVMKWSYPLVPGGDMQHTLGLAAPIVVSPGAPSLTAIRQRIAAQGAASTSPLGDTWLTLPVASTTEENSGIVAVVLANTPPSDWYVTDTQGNVYATCAVSPAFGVAGGALSLGVFASISGIPLTAGLDSISVHLGSAVSVAAGGAWEVVNLSDTAVDGAAAAAVASSATQTDTEQSPQSGLTGAGALTADLVVAAVGALWNASGLTPGTVPARAFSVDTGLGFDPAQETAVPTNVANGVYAQLWVELGIAQGAGQWSVSGQLSQPATGWGALCLALPGTAASVTG